MAQHVIEPRAGTAAEYRALQVLWSQGRVRNGVTAWGTVGKPDIVNARVCGSRSGSTARFAIATRPRPLDFNGVHGTLHVDEENFAYCGPADGLTAAQTDVALRETFLAWMNSMIARGLGTAVAYGIVPDVWSAKLHQLFVPALINNVLTPARWSNAQGQACQDFVLEDGEYIFPGKWHIYYTTANRGLARMP